MHFFRLTCFILRHVSLDGFCCFNKCHAVAFFPSNYALVMKASLFTAWQYKNAHRFLIARLQQCYSQITIGDRDIECPHSQILLYCVYRAVYMFHPHPCSTTKWVLSIWCGFRMYRRNATFLGSFTGGGQCCFSSYLVSSPQIRQKWMWR